MVEWIKVVWGLHVCSVVFVASLLQYVVVFLVPRLEKVKVENIIVWLRFESANAYQRNKQLSNLLDHLLGMQAYYPGFFRLCLSCSSVRPSR